MAIAPDFGEFPDLRYAAERRRADRNRPFSPELEAEFASARLIEDRPLIRAVCTLATLVALARTAAVVAHGATAVILARGGVADAACIAMLVLSWSPAFERHYLPWARCLVPLRSALAAAHFAAAAALGQLGLVMLMPMLIIGPFFFLGLSFRFALGSGVLSFVVFVIRAFLVLPHEAALHCGVTLTFCLGATAIVALNYEKGRRVSFLDRYLIAELAQRDALTGAWNRRAFDEHFTRLWRQAAAQRCALAVVLIDVDHFKAFNDRYGHLAGDDALRRVARALRDLIRRPVDVLARYGGEEFVAILEGVDIEQAKRVGERMRRAVLDLGIEHRGSRTCGQVTISLGIAAIEPGPDRHCSGALQLADQALYQAKVQGRNRVSVLDEAEYRLLVTGVFRAGAATTMPRAEGARVQAEGEGACLRTG